MVVFGPGGGAGGVLCCGGGGGGVVGRGVGGGGGRGARGGEPFVDPDGHVDGVVVRFEREGVREAGVRELGVCCGREGAGEFCCGKRF